MTARQVMTQRIREAERELKYEEYAGREGDIVTGIIQQTDSRYTLLDLGRVEALLPQAEQVPYERPSPNTRLKAYIVEVRRTAKGPQIVVSRTHPGLILELFKLEVPEIADGIVELKACAREPGHRTKIAVWSNDTNVDPVGACVGARGARVRQVVNELNGEKIDIVPFSDDPYDFVMKALSPAKVKEVRIDVETGTATVIVPDFQLSLAIGKEGQNARLAARLTGWRVDIKSETQLADEEAYQGEEWAQGEWVVDPESGEQVWVPAEGGPAALRRGVGPRRRRARGAGDRQGAPRPDDAEAPEAEEPEAEDAEAEEPEADAERRGPEAQPTDALTLRSRQAEQPGRRHPEAEEEPDCPVAARPAADLRGVPARAGQDELVRVVRRPDGTLQAGRTLPGGGRGSVPGPPPACSEPPGAAPSPGRCGLPCPPKPSSPAAGRASDDRPTSAPIESCPPAGSCEDGRPSNSPMKD